jgi:YVTN family beta-propeller protein
MMLYVENTRGGDVSVVDLRTYKEVKRIPLGEGVHPDDIVASRDGKTLYLNCLLHIEGHPAPDATHDTSRIIAVSTDTDKILWEKEVRGQVGHMVISPDDRYLYIALFDMYFVLRFDTKTQESTYIPVHFIGGHGVRLSSDGKRLYLGSMSYSEIDVIDLAKQKVIQRIFFREQVRPFDITRDEKTAYVQTSWLHGFHVVDLAENRIQRTIALPALGGEVPVPVEWPNTFDHGMILTPDEKHLVAVATTGGYASIYSVPELDLVASVPVGKEPNWVITDDSSETAYVSNRVSNTISVISIPKRQVAHTIEVGIYPQRMWIAN